MLWVKSKVVLVMCVNVLFRECSNRARYANTYYYHFSRNYGYFAILFAANLSFHLVGYFPLLLFIFSQYVRKLHGIIESSYKQYQTMDHLSGFVLQVHKSIWYQDECVIEAKRWCSILWWMEKTHWRCLYKDIRPLMNNVMLLLDPLIAIWHMWHQLWIEWNRWQCQYIQIGLTSVCPWGVCIWILWYFQWKRSNSSIIWY